MEPTAKRARVETHLEMEYEEETETRDESASSSSTAQPKSFLASLMSMVQQPASSASPETSAALVANDEMRPIDATNVNEDALQFLQSLIAKQPEGLVIAKSRHSDTFWRLVATLRHPGKFVDNDNPNHTVTSDCYERMMSLLPANGPDEIARMDERVEMELFVSVSNYFKTLLVACDTETEHKFLEPLLRAPTFLGVHAESAAMRFAFKNALDLKLNAAMNANANASRQNPMFKFSASAIVAVKPGSRPNLKFQAYDLHPCSHEYLSKIVYETIAEKMPTYKNKISSNVTFNLCHKAGTPVVYGLDRAKLQKLEPDLRFCHVTINDGFLTAWRNNMLYLRVTLYVNFFLWDKNNL